MRIFITVLLLSLCLSACAPASSSSSGSSSAPEVSSGLSVQYDSPEEPPEITASAGETSLPWAMRPENWNGVMQCGTDLATGLIESDYARIPAGEPGSTVTVSFPEDAVPQEVLVMAEARDPQGMPVGEGGEMVTLETSLSADGTLTFQLPVFETDPSCTAVLFRAAWGENTAWYALALQTGSQAPGPEQNSALLQPVA